MGRGLVGTLARIARAPCLLPSGKQQMPLNLVIVFSEKLSQPRVLSWKEGSEVNQGSDRKDRTGRRTLGRSEKEKIKHWAQGHFLSPGGKQAR